MSYMANYWVGRGWTITLLTLDDDSISPFFDLDSGVRRVPLGIVGDSPHLIAGLWNNLRRVHVLRKAIRESNPDVVISFLDQTNVLTLLAILGLNIRIIVSERIDPNVYRLGTVWERLRWWAYSQADRIVVQSRAALVYFLPKFQGRTVVIPNPVVALPHGKCSGDRPSPGPSIIAAGRLTEQKQFDLLLRAFARIKDRYPAWTLTILGEGPLRPVLESLCAQLGLKDRVSLPGFVKNPHDYFRHANLFVMSSRFEGFPNALCEAMAYGLPVISTDSTSGLRDIIRDGENGILVPSGDEESLAAAMARLLGNAAERQRLASRAVEVAERFGLETVMGMWEEVLNDVREKRLA